MSRFEVKSSSSCSKNFKFFLKDLQNTPDSRMIKTLSAMVALNDS